MDDPSRVHEITDPETPSDETPSNDNGGVAAPEEALAGPIADDEMERDRERDNKKPDQPWREPVNGAALFDEIAAFIDRHMAMPPGGTDLVSLFPVASHALYRCQYEYAPRLLITGFPDTGKSTLMKILTGLCARPFINSDISKAPLFRAIDEDKPTILIDEAHRNLAEHNDLLTVLHQGWDYNTAWTTRMDGKTRRTFCTFALAILAGVGDFGGHELKSRAFILELIANTDRQLAKFVPRAAAATMERLRRMMLRWTIDNRQALMDADPGLPLAVSRNRISDLAGVLLRAPDVAGGDLPERARNAITIVAADNPPDDDNLGRVLLEAIAEIVNDPDQYLYFEDPTDAAKHTLRRKPQDQPQFVWTVELAQALRQRRDLPFDKLTPPAMAKLLSTFRRAKLRTEQKQTGGRGSPNWHGYRLDDLNRAFALYGIGGIDGIGAAPSGAARPLDQEGSDPSSGLASETPDEPPAIETDTRNGVGVARAEARHHGRGSDWATEQYLYDQYDREFRFTLDVCANERNAKHPNYFTEEINGLIQDWGTHRRRCRWLASSASGPPIPLHRGWSRSAGH